MRGRQAATAAALQLRYLQTLTEVGVYQNSTIVVFPLPIDVIRPFLETTESRPDDDPVAMTAAEDTATLPAGVAASQAKTRVSLTPELTAAVNAESDVRTASGAESWVTAQEEDGTRSDALVTRRG